MTASGRLTSVCELTTATGSGSCAQTVAQTGYWTKYTYDVLDNLTGVTQNAQSASTQSRTYTYDALHRLKSEANPETGTVSYTYDSDATCGTSRGDLVKRVASSQKYHLSQRCVCDLHAHQDFRLRLRHGQRRRDGEYRRAAGESLHRLIKLTNYRNRFRLFRTRRTHRNLGVYAELWWLLSPHLRLPAKRSAVQFVDFEYSLDQLRSGWRRTDIDCLCDQRDESGHSCVL